MYTNKDKDRAWKMFSKYIRVRDALKSTGTEDRCKCYTCGRFFPIKKLQAGHYIDGRSNSILFDETTTKAQCYECNVIRKEDPEIKEVFRRKLIMEHGLEFIEFIENHSKEPVILSYEEVYQEFKKKYDLLGKEFDSWFLAGE